MEYPESVDIVEVGPRDGLQNESVAVPVAVKVALIEALVASGVRSIECGSFVSPKWVPQMAGTAEVFEALKRVPGVSYIALVPNLKGLEAALALTSGISEIAIFAAASETFSQRNINCSISESLVRLRAVAEAALARGIKVRGYVSCVLGCPYEGEIAPAAVMAVAGALAEMGCYQVSLGDTIGTGTPVKTRKLLDAVSRRVPADALAVHFHDTWGQAIANILVALQSGIRVIDSSVSGLGGCPYAPGAAGNVATEDVLFLCRGMGVETGIDLDKLAAAGRMICRELGRPPASKAALAMESACREERAL